VNGERSARGPALSAVRLKLQACNDAADERTAAELHGYCTDKVKLERSIPLAVKLSYTGFVMVLVPVYWVERGPANFLWASDIALLATVAALWRESRFVSSTMAVGVLLPELGWNLDFFLRLVSGTDLVGLNATGYMFNPDYPRVLKVLSLFHVFLPVLLLWLVARLGYDRRALPAQTLLTWVLLPVCYAFTGPERNLNWVFGLGNPPAPLLPGVWHVLALMIAFPLCLFWPAHLLLRRLAGRAAAP